MSKFYPNCDQDGFRVDAYAAYVIEVYPQSRFFFRLSKGRVLTAWHWAGAKIYLCFNDAKVQADRLRTRGKDCMVQRLDVAGWAKK